MGFFFLIFREVNEDNVLFRNVLMEFEESFKYVSIRCWILLRDVYSLILLDWLDFLQRSVVFSKFPMGMTTHVLFHDGWFFSAMLLLLRRILCCISDVFTRSDSQNIDVAVTFVLPVSAK